MTIGKYLKTIGLTLSLLVEKTEQNSITLRNWYNNPKKRKVFDYVVLSVLEEVNKERTLKIKGDTNG